MRVVLSVVWSVLVLGVYQLMTPLASMQSQQVTVQQMHNTNASTAAAEWFGSGQAWLGVVCLLVWGLVLCAIWARHIAAALRRHLKN